MVANSSFKQELLLREYGINVQNIVKYILTVPDKADRTRLAHLLVNLMAKLNPSMREIQDSQQKFWNHLYVMSDAKLDVDSPYPLSAMEYLNEKPQRMDLPTQVAHLQTLRQKCRAPDSAGHSTRKSAGTRECYYFDWQADENALQNL